MIAFPHAKINLGLQVIEKRTDGFHNINTLFYPITWQDILEVIELPGSEETNFHSTGYLFESQEKNLCVKAWDMLKENFPGLPPVKIHLHKTIPLGAGLGGGSSDAAEMLMLLNKKFNLELSGTDLQTTAARLGSDCAFFTQPLPCLASSRGEVLSPISIKLDEYKILIVCPPIHVRTAEAFQRIKPAPPAYDLSEIIKTSPPNWKNKLGNDFETTIFSEHLILAQIKEQLYNAGAVYASMSGSGSSLFGIFLKNAEPEIIFPAGCISKWV
ncbi:MAG: 4-(cytidine 5'-diphospho)-2-C-methyl-D-erythritol kinase [Ferruginibacter sp.]